MEDKMKRAEEIRKSVEESVKEKIYASQQKEDVANVRLQEARYSEFFSTDDRPINLRKKMFLEEDIKATNYQIRMNLINNLSRKNRDKGT